MNDPYRVPHQPVIEVRLICCTGDTQKSAQEELQDLLTQGFQIECHSAANNGEFSTRWLWTMVRRG